MADDLQELQRQSNATIKKLRQFAVLHPELDTLLSIMNARLRRLERSFEESPKGSKEVADGN